MLNNLLKNHWFKLLSGNLSIGLLVVGIPIVVLFTIMQTIAVPTAGLLVLVIVHVSLVGLQIARKGTWIPEKWLAAGYVFLPMIDALQTVRWFAQDFWFEGLWAFVMALVSSFFTICIVKNQWRKWRSPKVTTVTIIRPSAGDDAANYPADDPTTMVY